MPSKDIYSHNYKDPHDVKTKTRERKERLVEYLGEMLVPQTEGFPHINLDLSFTNLNIGDLFWIQDRSISIILCNLYKLKQSEYLLRGDLATFLNSHRSKDAKSMDMFTTVITKQEQSFTDKTDKKEKFSWFKFGKKKKEGG